MLSSPGSHPISRPALGTILTLTLLLSGVASASPAGATGGTDWSTFGYDVQRTGYNPNETILGVGNVGNLQLKWSFNLSSYTIAQPVLANGVNVGGTLTDLVLLGDEHGDFYAINAATGLVVWQQNLGSVQTQCFDIPDGIFGVSGTAVIDRSSNRVYAAGGAGQVYALDLSTGAIASGWPVTITVDPTHEHVWSALNLWQGNLFVDVAGLCDVPPYHGRSVQIDASTAKQTAVFYTLTKNGPSGGALWSWGGVSVDPANSNVYVATGNALVTNEHAKFAEHVVRLSPKLQVKAANYPGLVGFDVDFGSTPVLYQAPGCPAQLAVKNKSGVLFVYGRDSISQGPSQRLQVASVSGEFFDGDVVYWPTANRIYVANSSDSDDGTYKRGLVAFQIQSDCTLQLAWQQQFGQQDDAVPSPMLANGVIYDADGITGQVLAFDAQSGQQLWTSGTTIGGALYASPTIVNGVLYAGAWDFKLYAFAPFQQGR